jgi:hypothetical protein
MFEWLDDEIAAIKTRRFHRVDGPDSESARRTAAETDALLPPSYVVFARRYGRASLYRMPRLDLYWLRVLAPPLEARAKSGGAHVGDECFLELLPVGQNFDPLRVRPELLLGLDRRATLHRLPPPEQVDLRLGVGDPHGQVVQLTHPSE